MKNALKIYINKLFSYLPVAVFIFSLLMFINISSTVSELKAEHGLEAIDVFIDLYLFYFFRTVLLALIIPIYDLILSTQKISYKNTIIIHGLLIITSVGVLYYQPGIDMLSMLLSLGMAVIIYVLIWGVIIFREKQFLNEANEIFKENKE